MRPLRHRYGPRIFGFSLGAEEGDPLGLFEISSEGGILLWRTPLDTDEGETFYGELRLAITPG